MSIARTIVKFNRNSGQWESINGQTIAWGKGKEARRLALLAALEHDHAVLYAALADTGRGNADLIDRLLKAAGLVAKGNLSPRPEDPDIYTVKSQSGDGSYTVAWAGFPKQPACDCPSFEFSPLPTDYGPACKHVLAALLYEFTR